MLQGTRQQAQGVLQTAGQGRVTLAAQDDLGMFEAGKGQSEMVKPVFQLLAADDDAETVRVGEVGQTHAARLLGLRKMTSRSAPCRAFQSAIRRSRVRRNDGPMRSG